IYSIISVALASLFLEIIPIIAISNDIILNAVAEGFLSGAGIGITLKWGASTGGMDIVALVLSRLRDRPVGTYFLLLNGMIIIVAGLLYEPENALYTILTLYITTRVIDRINKRHEKVTAMVIPEQTKELQTAIYNKKVLDNKKIQ